MSTVKFTIAPDGSSSWQGGSGPATAAKKHPFTKSGVSYKLEDLIAERKPIPEYDFDVGQVWDYLETQFASRIVYLDGGMGTEIQKYKLEEEDYRGTVEEFLKCPKEMKNNNDLLSITQPDLITNVHMAYLRAGSDLIETNTFNGTTIS